VSCLYNVCMCDVYELQRMRKDVAVVLYIWAKIMLCLCNVCTCDTCKLISKLKNRSIYCIALMCICAKAESCLCSICVYIIYKFNVWIKRCYCSVCDYAACKLIWKCEKLINLLHHICLYMRKSWIMSLQYIYIYILYVSCSMYAKTLLFFCVYASFNASMTALLLSHFSTVCELNMWVKRCYCSVNVNEIVQLFWQA